MVMEKYFINLYAATFALDCHMEAQIAATSFSMSKETLIF